MSPLDPTDPYGDWERRRIQGLASAPNVGKPGGKLWLPRARQAIYNGPSAEGGDQTPATPPYGGGLYIWDSTTIYTVAIQEGMFVSTANYDIGVSNPGGSQSPNLSLLPYCTVFLVGGYGSNDVTLYLCSIDNNGNISTVAIGTPICADPGGAATITDDNAYVGVCIYTSRPGEGGAIYAGMAFFTYTDTTLTNVATIPISPQAGSQTNWAFFIGMDDINYLFAMSISSGGAQGDDGLYLISFNPTNNSVTVLSQDPTIGANSPGYTGGYWDGTTLYVAQGDGTIILLQLSDTTLTTVTTWTDTGIINILGITPNGKYLIGQSGSTYTCVKIKSGEVTDTYVGESANGNYGYGQWLLGTFSDTERFVATILNNNGDPVPSNITTQTANPWQISSPPIPIS